ncbi:MAG: TrkH family potassium uptake protein [Candidatus Thermoplasmatota archaeon]|nr:TrkH family potassium uptake protein [Candidatus Thermoplasmatota archaeon]
MSDLRTVLRDIGGIFIIVGFVSLIALLVPLINGEIGPPVDGIGPLLITSAMFFGIGLPFYYLCRNAEPANFKTAMVTAALGWLLISLVGSIPFWLMPYNIENLAQMAPLSAFFESMSGWTGTGLTMVTEESLLPATLQFWRSLIQWIGGVGVIVLTLSVLARPGTGSFVLYRGEARDQKTHPSIVSTVRTIWWIFLLYTVIGVVLLWAVGLFDHQGMNMWQALNHAMTGLATGGFSVASGSMTNFGTPTRIAVLILMILGAIAFVAHYDLLKGHIRKFLSDAQLKAMVALIILGVIGLTIANLSLYTNVFESLKESGFQFISAITCTGFATADLMSWGEGAKLILAFAMIIGGAAGSTAGGIKLFRAILLYRGVGWRIKRAISTPRRVFVYKFGEKSLSKDDAMDLINEAAIISFMWVILLIVGIFVMLAVEHNSLSNTVFEVCSAQGNVGLTAGITSITMEPVAKVMLIFNMWIGRLEIIPIIVLIKSMFGIRRNIL